MCNTKKDDNAISGQIRNLYARGNTLIKTSEIVVMKLSVYFLKPIVLDFMGAICGATVLQNPTDDLKLHIIGFSMCL